MRGMLLLLLHLVLIHRRVDSWMVHRALIGGMMVMIVRSLRDLGRGTLWVVHGIRNRRLLVLWMGHGAMGVMVLVEEVVWVRRYLRRSR